jgi:predicted nucleic acid-binding protein
VIVVDASALLEVLLHTEAGLNIRRRLFTRGEALNAPHLIDVEIAQVIRRFVSRNEIGPEEGLALLDIVANLPLQRYPHTILLPRMWELRGNLSAYDASYVALAEALDAPLLTHDGGLARSGNHRAQIQLV